MHLYFVKQVCAFIIMLLRSGRKINRCSTKPSNVPEEDISRAGRNLIRKPVDVCPICIDSIVRPYRLRCHHIYCAGCLFRLIRHEGRAAKCPMCRRRISSNYEFITVLFAAAGILVIMLCFVIFTYYLS